MHPQGGELPKRVANALGGTKIQMQYSRGCTEGRRRYVRLSLRTPSARERYLHLPFIEHTYTVNWSDCTSMQSEGESSKSQMGFSDRPRAPITVCDQCNYRKIRCRKSESGGHTCRGCERAGIECTAIRTPKRRGPKWKTKHPSIKLKTYETGQGRSLDDLAHISPENATSQSQSFAGTRLPNGAESYHRDSQPAVTTSVGTNTESPTSPSAWINDWNAIFTQDDTDFLSFDMGINGFSTTNDPSFGGKSYSSQPQPFLSGGAESVVLSTLASTSQMTDLTNLASLPENRIEMEKHLHVYLDRVALYIKVLSNEEMLDAFAQRQYDSSVSFRALLLAAIGMALASDAKDDPDDHGSLAKQYLKAARRCLALSDTLEGGSNSLASIVTCMHLFMAHEWLKDHRTSWENLQTAITMAQRLGLDRWNKEQLLLSDSERIWLSTRLKIYYLLCLLERSNALLRPLELSFTQGLRLPGRPWISTFAFRNSLSQEAFAGLQSGHVEIYDLVDEKIIRCSRRQCGLSMDDCGVCLDWTPESVESFQKKLEGQLKRILNFRPEDHGVPSELPAIYQAHLALNIVWLQKIVHEICVTHGLMLPWADKDCLKYDYVSNNFAKVVETLSEQLKEACVRDISKETCFRLAELATSAAQIVLSFDSSPLSKQAVLPMIVQCLGILISSVQHHDSTQTLIKAAASLIT